MDWWTLGAVAAVLFLAVILDGAFDKPEWLEEAPWIVRVGVRAVAIPLVFAAILFGFYLASLFWQVVGAALLVAGILWVLYRTVAGLSGLLEFGDEESAR